MANVPAQNTQITSGDGAEVFERQFDRMPPHDLDAEMSTLGGMLLNKDTIGEVVEVLKAPRPHVFYRPAHELIYRAVYELWSAGEPADPITTAAELSKRGEISRVGGVTYLHTLVQSVPTAANAAYYADIVLERSKRRRAVEIGTILVQQGYADEGETDAIIDRALGELQDLTMATMDAPKLSVADRWEDFCDEQEQGEDPAAIDSPWNDLNEVVRVKAGSMVTVGAETSGGKSLLALNWGTHVALGNEKTNTPPKPVLVFSMEMQASELMARIAASVGNISLTRLEQRALEEDDWKKMARIDDKMRSAKNFILDDSGTVTLGMIRARARWMASQGMPVGLIVVDYLQLMEAETKSAGSNRTQDISTISRGLKRIAMDFGVPVITLAQFNREAKDRKPKVTDFKESSSIEQDSNVILLLHTERDEEGNLTKPGEVEMIVAKNRNGVRDRAFPLAKLGHYAKLANMARV